MSVLKWGHLILIAGQIVLRLPGSELAGCSAVIK
jgi:hypothetical protein